ncbi:MAG: cache domain-containing protein [Planctomycetota bacterium]|nr:cache domain-containing protein [Planctomycetota bacterium]
MSLRARLILSMLSMLGIAGGVCAVIGANLLWRNLSQEAEDRVEQDLNAAAEFYQQRLAAMASTLRYTALGERFLEAVEARETTYIAPRLDALRQAAALDILDITDARGTVVYRSQHPGSSGDSLAQDPLVASVLAGGDVTTATLLVPMAALGKEDPRLAERARVPVLATPMAAPTAATELTEGMMLCGAAPVRGAGGKLCGVLRSGILLNQNHDLVDQVQNTVFRNEQYGGKPLGTATIFQDDVRICTNVLQADKRSRATGTRASAEVRDRVLGQGLPWLGRAWVVNDWYLAAYAPIQDPDHKPIGMLYVGVQQRRFDDVALKTLLTFGVVTAVGLAAAGLVAWKLGDSISRPVRELARASETIARGDFCEMVPVRSSDEISALARTFNAMAASLRQRDEQLKERTRQQLTRSERLAAVGRLAAGVAHEINNPLTGVLTFSHMVLRDAPAGSQQHEDIEAIIEATTRCRDIIRGLLNFSRQNEPQKRLSNLSDVLHDALNLTRNQALLHRVTLLEQLDPHLPALVIDPHQVQEVAVNIILNAIDAMPDGGALNIRSHAVEGGRWVEFEMADTGHGIPAEILDRIFDPFFTTKPPGKGTGLGLAISYGIITEHGGDISVSSEVGRGTTVTVRLPVERKKEEPNAT